MEWNYEIYDRELLSDLHPSRMALLRPRIKPWDNHLFGPQEFDILQKCTKVKLQTSTMVTPLIRIRHQTHSSTWQQNDLIWYFIMMTWFYIWQRHRQWRHSAILDMEAIKQLIYYLTRDQQISNATLKFEEKNVLFFQGKNYIPKNYELRQEITSQFHDKITAGHSGEIETLNTIKEHYWWPGMRTFIKNYVKGCGICQQFKINQNPSNSSYIQIPGPANTRPFANFSMDMITDLPPITLENGTC